MRSFAKRTRPSSWASIARFVRRRPIPGPTALRPSGAIEFTLVHLFAPLGGGASCHLESAHSISPQSRRDQPLRARGNDVDCARAQAPTSTDTPSDDIEALRQRRFDEFDRHRNRDATQLLGHTLACPRGRHDADVDTPGQGAPCTMSPTVIRSSLNGIRSLACPSEISISSIPRCCTNGDCGRNIVIASEPVLGFISTPIGS